MFIGPTEAADIAASVIERTFLERKELTEKCGSVGVIVAAVEPLCRSARKEMRRKRFELQFGEKRIELDSTGRHLRHISQPFSRIYACAMKSHKYGTMSSHDPDLAIDENNRRGCLCFDIMHEQGLFRKKKSWARYYVSVFIEGASDNLNESLAGCAARVLMDAASCRLYELPDEEIKEETTAAVEVPSNVGLERYSFTIELISEE